MNTLKNTLNKNNVKMIVTKIRENMLREYLDNEIKNMQFKNYKKYFKFNQNFAIIEIRI